MIIFRSVEVRQMEEKRREEKTEFKVQTLNAFRFSMFIECCKSFYFYFYFIIIQLISSFHGILYFAPYLHTSNYLPTIFFYLSIQ